MGVFVVLHMIKDILAKTSKEGVSSLYIPLLTIYLITNKVGRVLRCREAMCGGSKHSNIYSL
jgi:hypothetical protein